MVNPQATGANVVVRLLDSARRQALQEWKFQSASVITIGRSPDREIVIPDTLISRLHVVLQNRGNEWWLLSMGQNGVQIDGQKVDECRLTHGLTFRLGQSGPLLEFCDADRAIENQSNTSLDLRLDEVQKIELDQAKLNDEVRAIADGEFFKNLSAKASSIRREASGR